MPVINKEIDPQEDTNIFRGYITKSLTMCMKLIFLKIHLATIPFKNIKVSTELTIMDQSIPDQHLSTCPL